MKNPENIPYDDFVAENREVGEMRGNLPAPERQSGVANQQSPSWPASKDTTPSSILW